MSIKSISRSILIMLLYYLYTSGYDNAVTARLIKLSDRNVDDEIGGPSLDHHEVKASSSTGNEGRLLEPLLERIQKLDHDQRDESGIWPFSQTSECFPIFVNGKRSNNYNFGSQKKNEKTITDDDVGINGDDCGLTVFTEESVDEKKSDDGITDEELVEWLHNTYHDRDSSHDHSKNDKKRIGKKKHSDRVVGGTQVEVGKYPWLVAFGNKSFGQYCGGSLISNQWVLTAGHCLNDYEKPCALNVRLGASNWFFDFEDYHVDRDVISIHRHPKYNFTINEARLYDIALLKLSKPVLTNKQSAINTVCLPTKPKSVTAGTLCTAAGWGTQQAHSKVYGTFEVELPVLSYGPDVCGDYPVGSIGRGTVCVGYVKENKDTCQGDSGGPLVYQRDSRYYQLGVTSWGAGCAFPGYPGIYTDVGYYIDWIRETIAKNR